MTLHRLIYYSRNRIPRDAQWQVEVDRILAASRRNNDATGITGALMFNAGCFAQVLEGDREVVEATFERIQQDERHGEVTVLSFKAADHRVFGLWSMDFPGQADAIRDQDAGTGSTTGFDLSAMAGEQVFNLLRKLSSGKGHIAA